MLHPLNDLGAYLKQGSMGRPLCMLVGVLYTLAILGCTRGGVQKCVCVCVPLGKPRILMDWRLLVKEYLANYGMP